MENVKLTIDGIEVEVPVDYTVLEAAEVAQIDIPTLCYLKNINQIGACRMCIVEIEGMRGFVTSCTQPVANGMVVKTNTPQLIEARKVTMELLLSNHANSCTTCVRNTNCELQALAKKLNVTEIEYEGEKIDMMLDEISPSIVRDPNKCILCGRCVAMCKQVQKVGAIEKMNRGFNTVISGTFNMSLANVNCVNCGQCINVCPTGALSEKDNTKEVWKALQDKDKYVVVQTAPAVRAALGEEFGLPIGTLVTGKMVSALKKLGFDKVFDTDTAADLTIMEEATELIERINNKGVLPMITSCSPGWIKYIEHHFPEQLDHLSTCKSPHQMFGAIIKSYYANKINIDPKNIVVVSVMPCVAKKFEAKRSELSVDGLADVDVVLTTREIARMIKQANIDFVSLSEEQFDDPMGEATGAAVIFGTTGGVMEAALRTAQDLLTGTSVDKIDFTEVRGKEGLKEATVSINGLDINVAVAHGLANAEKVMKEINDGTSKYHFIEIMACPGGCIMGGGQPIHTAKEISSIDIMGLRAKALYDADSASKIRKSHDNPAIKKMYEEYLEKPGSHIAHELLHTTYTKRDLYNK
ncbi:MAG: NADH-dependent [FeFe] hydrogenase, group A6 [Clostridia bacterium]|nr:NADH-dependent [FeFe] hydrogenase, group A6 [Clostridia bacterium]